VRSTECGRELLTLCTLTEFTIRSTLVLSIHIRTHTIYSESGDENVVYCQRVRGKKFVWGWWDRSTNKQVKKVNTIRTYMYDKPFSKCHTIHIGLLLLSHTSPSRYFCERLEWKSVLDIDSEWEQNIFFFHVVSLLPLRLSIKIMK
jgi:hypothetical protein